MRSTAVGDRPYDGVGFNPDCENSNHRRDTPDGPNGLRVVR